MTGEDPRFIREGRSLRDWLPDLLANDSATRRKAENAICAMKWGAPVADITVHQHRPADWDAHCLAFSDAIASVLNDPTFDGEAFIMKAMLRIRQDAADRHELLRMEDEYFDAELEESPVKREKTQELLHRISQAHLKEKAGRLPNSSGPHTVNIVLECAGPILLRMPELVRKALREDLCSRAIATALKKLGPAAIEFAPELLALDRPGSQSRGIRFPSTLAAVGGHDANTVRELLRIIAEDRDAAFSAADTLEKIGPSAVRLVPTIADDLLKLLEDPERAGFILHCLPVMAPERRDVFNRVLELARAAPPDKRQIEGHPQYTYDAVMHRRGSAIEAMAHFPSFADEAVPVLIEALQSFEEYDPDWCYELGAHGRVVHALRKMGPAAAAATSALATRLRMADKDVDWEIVRFLGDLGSPAAAALPALRELQSQLKPDAQPDDKRTPTRDSAPIAWAIAQIEACS